MPGIVLDFCKITKGRVNPVILKYHNMIYCKMKKSRLLSGIFINIMFSYFSI